MRRKPKVEVTFQQADGKVSLRSNDWSIRGKNGVILRDSNFMETFQIEIMGELSIKEPAVIKASAIKADDLKVPAPPVVAYGWVQYNVEGEKPNGAGIRMTDGFRYPYFILKRKGGANNGGVHAMARRMFAQPNQVVTKFRKKK